MAKRIVTPFADLGDRAAMPDEPSGSDSNYETGYPSEYQQDPVLFPATAKFVERDKANQLNHDITSNIKEWQEHPYPAFIAAADNGGVPFAYRKDAVVVLGGVDYISLEDANEDVPPSAKWKVYNRSEQDQDTLDHINNTSNPHGVSKSQVGLSNVDNQSASTIQAGTTKENVGLSLVDNQSVATILSQVPVNVLDEGVLQNSWVCGDTGYTIKTGNIQLAAGASGTITWDDAFTSLPTSIQLLVREDVSNVGVDLDSWNVGTINLTSTAASIINVHVTVIGKTI